MIPQSRDQERSKLLLVALIGLLPKPIRDNFDKFLDKRFFDYQIHEMMRFGQFPDWFQDLVQWDPLHGKCIGLRYLLQLAVRDLMLEFNSNFCYRVIITGDKAWESVKKIDVDEKKFKEWVRELEERLNRVPPDIIRLSGKAGKKQHIPGEEGESKNDVIYEPI